MPGEKRQQIDPKNKGFEEHPKRSVDRGVSVDKNMDKTTAVKEGVDIFQREKKLQENILRAYKEKKISKVEFRHYLLPRLLEHDLRAGLEVIKKSNLSDEEIAHVILVNPGSYIKHKGFIQEFKKTLEFKKKNLTGEKQLNSIHKILAYLDEQQKKVPESITEYSRNIGNFDLYTRNPEARKLYTEIDAHYAEYVRLKKLKELDYKNPRSAAETLAESTLQEFFAPETEPQKVNHFVGVNINSRNKERAKQLRRFRRLLDETLNDPEQSWREKQQEFAREVAIDKLQKEIKKSLEKTNPKARLEFKQTENEYVVTQDSVEISCIEDGHKNILYKSISRDKLREYERTIIFPTGKGLSYMQFTAENQNTLITSVTDKGLRVSTTSQQNDGFLIEKFSRNRIDRDSLDYQETKIKLSNEGNIYNLNEEYFKNSKYFEFLSGMDLDYIERGNKSMFIKENRNQANLLFVAFDGEKKNLYCEGKGVVVENILDTYKEGAFIDESWARYIRLADGRWAIYHDQENSKDCLKVLPRNLIPVGEIYQPIDKMVFVAHELNTKGESIGSVIVDKDGNKISQRHNKIDFKGEYIFGEYIYIKKNDSFLNPDGPEEIWGTTSGRLAASGSSIKKIWGVQDRLYWINGKNEFFTKYTDKDTHKDVVVRIGQYDDSKIEFITRMTKDGENDRIIYPDIMDSIKPGAVGLDFIDWQGKSHVLDNRHFWNILKVESIQEKCLVVQEHKGKITVYIEGIGDVGGEWDKIYFLKEYENQLLICGRRGDEIIEVAVDLDKKLGLTKEEADKLKLLNLLKKYDWLAYEERSLGKKQSNTYSKAGKEKLAEKTDKLKNEREELKKKLLDYFENDSAMREIWQNWDPEKNYRSHSENFAEKITKMIRTSPELFLDYFRAKKDRNVEKMAREMVDFIFKEDEEKLKNLPAKNDHWAKKLAREMASRLFGEKYMEGVENWLRKKTKIILKELNLADFFQDRENVQIAGGDPKEKGPGLEVMKFGREYKGFICDEILGKCDDGKHWNKINFPAKIELTEPTKETTVTINVDKKWDKIILPKPVQSAIISSRIKGITSNGEEISLEKSSIENDFGQRTVFLNPNDDFSQIRYSWKENQFETEMSEIEEYDTFRNKFIRENGVSDLSSDIAPKMDENFGEILEKIKLLSPKGKVEAIEEFVKNIGYYDMNNLETLKNKSDKTFDEKLLIMGERMDHIKKNNPKLAGKLKDKFLAGVCADYALLTIALLRKAGFMAGYAGGFDVKGKKVTSKEAHAKAFVVWLGKDGNATLHLVDGTPGGIDEKQQKEIDRFLNIETIEKKEKITSQKKEQKIKTVENRVQELMSLRVEDIAEIDNGELEKILNDYQTLITKKSHLKIVERVLNAFWYTGSDKKDMSDQDVKRNIQFLLLEEFGKEYNSISEADKKVASGKEMFEMVETFIDKFKKEDKNLTTGQALERLRTIIDTVPKGLLSRPERVAMEIIIKYLEAKKMNSQFAQK